jgi:hypothetical protein
MIVIIYILSSQPISNILIRKILENKMIDKLIIYILHVNRLAGQPNGEDVKAMSLVRKLGCKIRPGDGPMRANCLVSFKISRAPIREALQDLKLLAKMASAIPAPTSE